MCQNHTSVRSSANRQCSKMVLLRVLVLMMLGTNGVARKLIYPPVVRKPNPPTCTALSSVCHLSYRYVDEDGTPLQMMDSESPMCRCSHGNECATDWDNRNNSIVKKLHTEGNQDMEVKISYCQMEESDKQCAFHEPVLEMKGRGPIIFQLVHDQICKCARRFYVHASWTEGEYDYFQYSCGKPRCIRLSTDICTTLTLNSSDDTIRHDYHCRCRRDEQCLGQIPSSSLHVTEHKCVTNVNKKDNLVF